jgi:DNA-binding CsgD family transcriptional regulator
MFGTELHLITVLYLILELVILITQISVCLTRPKDNERIRFFILISLFIIFNLCNGLFPNLDYGLSILSQLIIAYASGIALVTYYFYYLTKELNIKTKRFYNTKFLISSVLTSFFVGFVITYLAIGDINFSKEIFIIPPLFIALYFCIRTIIFIFKNQPNSLSHYKMLTLSGYIGIVFMASMPFVVFFGDHQSIKVSLINISFLLSAIAYYKIYLYQGKIEYEVLSDVGFFSLEGKEKDPTKLNDPFAEFGLTSREIEVLQLILKNLSYSEISENLHIVENTVSKHASNIFKKTKCRSKKELIAKFSEEKTG